MATYEGARLRPTAKLVELNRQEGPDGVLQLIEARAPNGFAAAGYANLEAVSSLAERTAPAARYKVAAGFDRDTLNAQASLSVVR